MKEESKNLSDKDNKSKEAEVIMKMKVKRFAKSAIISLLSCTCKVNIELKRNTYNNLLGALELGQHFRILVRKSNTK